ncbi:MAG: NADH-quinone oxidoreductase subunit N [Chloroflexota bacterium]|nr:NADH-quinone oxidoreductase subunit N [Chloroflexota bacterium]
MDLEYQLIIPEFVMAGLAVVVIAAALMFRQVDQKWFGYFTAAGLAVIAIVTAAAYWNTNDDFGTVLAVDHFTVLFRVFFLGIAFFTVMAAVQFAGDRLKNHAEFYGLIVFATLGMMLLAASRELLTAYLSLELLSFSFYILVGFNKLNPFSNEGSLKYMLLGAFSSALMLYGISLIYGVTGTTTYSAIGPDVAEGTRNIADQLASFAGGSGGVDPDGARPGLLIGLVLIIAGLGFKVSAVPFHQWTPDAYQGAPLPITAFLSAGGKAAAFAFFLRLFSEAFLPAAAEWVWFVGILAAVTMIVGNLMALQQTNFKRLMAYSSISQVGYLLVGIVALDAANISQSQDAASALVLHLIGYVTTNIAVFAAIIAFYNRTGRDDIVDLRGLAERQPFLAFAIAAALFSLAGMPLFAGFATKFIIFQAAFNNGFLWLGAIGVTASFVSLYYYLMVIKQMYLYEPEGSDRERFHVSRPLAGALVVLVAGVLFIGLYPTPLFDVIHSSTEGLFEQAAALSAAVMGQ